jgi:hypothetical protein
MRISGVPKDKLERLAKLYADPKKKIVSYWTMGFNQHTRGTWVEQHDLQRASADGERFRAGQRPVLADRASHRPAARRAKSARSRTGCRRTWLSPTKSTRADRENLAAS